MADDDEPAVALIVPVGLEHFAFVGGVDGRAPRAGDVQSRMAARRVGADLAEVGRDLSFGWPDGVELRDERAHGRPDGGYMQIGVGSLLVADSRRDGDGSLADGL